jgi:hypothetical protein
LCDGLGSCVQCLIDTDCAAGDACRSGVCTAPSCTDSELNADETDIDCGGSVCPVCDNGQACVDDGDCLSNFCDDGSIVVGTGGGATTGGAGPGGAGGMGGLGGAGGAGGATAGVGGAGGLGGAGGFGGAGGSGGAPVTASSSSASSSSASGTGGAGGSPGGLCAACIDDVQCAPFACVSGSCLTSCATDSECAPDHWCDGGTCVAQKVLGDSCAASGECLSGSCADAVCCDRACDGACEQCDAPTAGSCVVYAAGDLGAPTCTPYECDGSSGACPQSCALDGDCIATHYCDLSDNSCQAIKNDGELCGGANECLSGYCVDGYCCNSGCVQACDACDVGGAEGTCTEKLIGTAGDPACDPYLCNGAITTCPSSCVVNADCIAGYFCGSGTCQPLASNGTVCSLDNECMSGNCVDSYCCDTACGEACDACNLSGNQGTCTLRSDGVAGSPSCAPYLCDGSQAACPSGCSGDADCTGGNFCNGVACEPLKANGANCAANNECSSTRCVDGYCCNAACGSPCDACDVPGAEGTCSNAFQGSAGSPTCAPFVCSGAIPTCPGSCNNDAGCAGGNYCSSGNSCLAKKANGTSCNVDKECQSGMCVDGYCCDAACASACDACNLVGMLGTCSFRPDDTAGQPGCDPYLCDGTKAQCASSCMGDGDCVAGAYCDSGSCLARKPQGGACGGNNECQNNQCVDGYCCNVACGNDCDSCAVPGAEGTCTNVFKGSSGSPSCTPYLCNGAIATCPLNCVNNADCVAGYYCGGGTCQSLKNDGTLCSSAGECQSGNCVDSYCCDTPCGLPCDACNLGGSEGSCSVRLAGAAASPSCDPYLCDGALATCPTSCMNNGDCVGTSFCTGGNTCDGLKPNGQSCGNGSECQSGRCIDGYCCDTDCTQACDACNVPGSEGTCKPALQGSLGSPGCGTYVCDGIIETCPNSCIVDIDCSANNYCDGGNACVPQFVDGTACTQSNQCLSGNCVDGYCCDTACGGECDACNLGGSEGVCTVRADADPGTPLCTPYLCDGAIAMCPNMCVIDGDCAANFYCEAQACVPVKGDGDSCSSGTQCASGICTDGVCCDASCGDACESCLMVDTAQPDGLCSPIVANTDPDNECSAPYVCDGAAKCDGGVHLDSLSAGGTNYDYLWDMAVDAAGNSYAVGYFSGTLDFGCGAMVSNGTDVFVVKFDSTLTCVWSRNFASVNTQIAYGVGIDAAGNVAFTGYYYGTPDFGGGALPTPASTGAYVVKLNSAGNHLWSRAIEGPSSDYGRDVAIDAAGNVVVTGYSYSATLDLGGGALAGNGSGDVFVAKYASAAGAYLWGGLYGNTSFDTPYAIDIDPNGDAVVAGYFQLSMTVPPLAAINSAGGYDAFVIRLDGTTGLGELALRGGGTSSDYAYGVASDSMGNIFVTGSCNTGATFGGATSCSGLQAYVVKYTSAGAHAWTRTFGSSNSTYGRRIAVDTLDNAVFGGIFYGTINFSGQPADDYVSQGSADLFKAKLNGSDGSHIWGQGYGDPSYQALWGIGVDGMDRVYIGGYFAGTLNLGGGANDLTPSPPSAYDVFIGQFSP